MKRLTKILVLAILLAGLVPAALAQGPAGPTSSTAVDMSLVDDVFLPHLVPAPDGRADTIILDDFNRADGPIGPNWTVHDGYCNVSSNAAVCGSLGRATFNDAPGDGNAAEADIAAVGTALQYTGLLLNYGAGATNLFLKVQKQGGAPGQFTHAGCYTGNNGPSFGLGFFPLDAPFGTAHMKATRYGDDVIIEFTHIDGGGGAQTYICSGAPPPEGAGIGILGYAGIARLDNFEVPLQGIGAWKKAPPFAVTGEVISYTIVISSATLVDGMKMTDTLPAGVEYAGNLTWTDGDAWYDGGAKIVRWEYNFPKAAGAPAAPRPTVYDPAAVADRIGAPQPAGVVPAGSVTPWTRPAAVLWDNGPLVTHPGGGYNGADASALQTALGMGTYGFGHQASIGYRMADDFAITYPLGWQIDTITFFAYQTGTYADPPASPITGVYFQIWDGPPDDPDSSVVWGDLVTNRLLGTNWSNIYRVLDTNLLDTTRPIMANVASAGVTLPPGVYWLDWMTDGSLTSGPWAPPISILGETSTGNALHYVTAWEPALDNGTNTPQGMPFIIAGTLATPQQVTVTFDVTVTAPCGVTVLNEGWAVLGPLLHPFAAATTVLGESDIAVNPPALTAALCPDATATQPLEICNAGTCPLHWDLYEVLPPLARSGMPFVPVDVAGPAAKPGLTAASPPVRPAAVPAAAPADVLWDQPLSTVNQAAYVDQEFPDFATYSSFLADDFTNADPWLLESLFIPGDGWNGFSTLMNATALTWQIYADCAGVPCGDPAGGGAPPVWTLTLPPSHPLVTLTPGTPGGMPSNVQLDLPMPGVLPPGTWWLVFYPTMEFAVFGQYGRQAADTTNGYTAQFINPGEGFGLGPDWQDWTVLGATQTDIAFRLEGVVVPLTDIPWLSENPLDGVVPSAECRLVDATFDSTGLAVGNYFANLALISDDPDTPQVIVPVTMIVQAPAEIITITYAITDLAVAFAAEVTGTAPLTYTWHFGDGDTSHEASPTHTYSTGGTYTVTLELANCGTDQASVVVTVVGPVAGYRIYLPLVVRR